MRPSLVAAVLPVILASKVLGQAFTNATCSKSTEWTFNDLGQSPCLVAAFVGGVCFDGDFSVFALKGPTDKYAILTGNGINTCECNAVFYNLIQACAFCQGSEILSWSNFTVSCPAILTDPTGVETIPSDTSVPTWAFIDPRPLGSWNATQAKAYEASSSASITPGLPTPSG